jgi:hypothetical protein
LPDFVEKLMEMVAVEFLVVKMVAVEFLVVEMLAAR